MYPSVFIEYYSNIHSSEQHTAHWAAPHALQHVEEAVWLSIGIHCFTRLVFILGRQHDTGDIRNSS